MTRTCNRAPGPTDFLNASDLARVVSPVTGSTPASRIAAVPGAALGVLFAAVARLRPDAKPLHPHGSLLPATVRRHGLIPPVGVPWIDEAGEDAVTVRMSRSLGLPDALPDVHGLALRIPLDERHADLLLATTGSGRLTRFVFRPQLRPRAYTTLLPYETSTGPLLLAAFPRDEDAVEHDLACASPQGPWRTFARLRIAVDEDRAAAVGLEHAGPDPTVSFDPVLNQLPGLLTYPWVATLREGAYLAARRARGSAGEPT